MRKTKRNLVSLALLSLSLLAGCYQPAPRIKGKAALWPFQFTSPTGEKYSYYEKRTEYDEAGNPITLIKYYPENPNSLRNIKSRLEVYLIFKKEGTDLLKIQKKLER